jgi:hypothetical protein
VSSPITPIESLRKALTAQPMYVTESLSRHTTEYGVEPSGSCVTRFRSAVKSFPDVIKVGQLID